MSTPWGAFSYGYDALNRLTSLTNPQGRVFTFEYDAAGRRTALNYPNGIRATYAYDAAGQLLSVIHTRTAGSVIIAKSTYAYDAAGNRTSMTDMAGTHTFAYDDLHRLISATHPAASALPSLETFTLDAVGNRLADARITGYTYDAANRLLENASFTYGYDADGNRTSKQDKLTTQTTTYAFNSENQLVDLNKPNGESWTYKYDRPGRRIEKSSGTAPSQITRFVHDGDNILAILDGDNEPRQVFTNGLNIDEPLSMRSNGGVERYFHADALGSVRALTDAGAAIVETYAYEAYGRPVVRDAGGVEIALAASEGDMFFTSRVADRESGLQESRYRIYDPEAGVFTSADPLGYFIGTNHYGYVSARPTFSVDPFGLAQAAPGLDVSRGGFNPNDRTYFDWGTEAYKQLSREGKSPEEIFRRLAPLISAGPIVPATGVSATGAALFGSTAFLAGYAIGEFIINQLLLNRPPTFGCFPDIRQASKSHEQPRAFLPPRQ
jgi:RHS repeat-associated protein